MVKELTEQDRALLTLQMIEQRATEACCACRGQVFCVDESRGDLFFLTKGSRESRLELTTETPAGSAVLGNKVINIADAKRQPHGFIFEHQEGFRPKQVLCVPICADGKVIGCIQAMNRENNESFNPYDIKILEAVGEFLLPAIDNHRSNGVEACIRLQVASAVGIAARLSQASDLETLNKDFFAEVCEAMQCEYAACFCPANKGKSMRFDSFTLRAPHRVTVKAGTLVHAVTTSRGFVNNAFPQRRIRGGQLVDLEDVFCSQNGDRPWNEYLSNTVQKQLMTRESDYSCTEGIDFEEKHFAEGKWSNMLMLPVVTVHGTFVLQVAGKRDVPFSLADEELLLLVGPSYVLSLHWRMAEFTTGDDL